MFPYLFSSCNDTYTKKAMGYPSLFQSLFTAMQIVLPLLKPMAPRPDNLQKALLFFD
jgi:hypothetical protein